VGSVYRPKWKDKRGIVHESKVWWIKWYVDGSPRRECAETEKVTEARTRLKEREGEAAKGNETPIHARRVLFGTLRDKVVNDYKNNNRRTLDDLIRRLDKHILPVFGQRRLVSITTDHIRLFIDKRRNEEASNATINRELAAIGKIFSLAIQDKLIAYRPHIPKLKEDNTRKGFFERQQFEKVRAGLPEPLKPLATFAYITGWRTKSEVQTLKWPQVDFEAGFVRLEPGDTKNGQAREFPITQELRALLEQQAAKADVLLQEKGIFVEHVFFWVNGRPIKDFRGSWQKACIQAGLAVKVQIGEDVDGKPVFSWKKSRIPHDFRRTAVRNLVRAGVDRDTAMKMVGHETDSVFRRYNIIDNKDLEHAGKKLDQFHQAHGQSLGKVGNERPQFRVLDSPK
jgi:integrase